MRHMDSIHQTGDNSRYWPQTAEFRGTVVRRLLSIWLAMVLSALATASLSLAANEASSAPAVPPEIPVVLVGSPLITGSNVGTYTASFVSGRVAKAGPLALGEKIAAGAIRDNTVELFEEGGRSVLRRTGTVKRAGSDQVLVTATIDLEPSSLLPLHATLERGGTTTVMDYDWERSVVRRTPGTDGAEFDETSLDLPMFEIGAHDLWMAALELHEGFVARLPAISGGDGTKYWAVPRVVGSEPIDLGDGVSHEAWIVDLDWWGMGAFNTMENYTPGGRADGTGGPGGKYWVLKKTIPGTPRVVRIRTEVDAETDAVVQMQSDI